MSSVDLQDKVVELLDPVNARSVVVKDLGVQAYTPIWQKMKAFTEGREQGIADEIWMLEHLPVYTLGQAGKTEHILKENSIDLVKVDRGGQVTYHGPGQLVCYPLIDIKRAGTNVRELVKLLAKSVQLTLANWGISSDYNDDAPGVYVEQKKISSLGLRIRRGCSFHGLSLNVSMDLGPFNDINTCGYPGLEVTQMSDYLSPAQLPKMSEVKQCWLQEFCHLLNVEALHIPK